MRFALFSDARPALDFRALYALGRALGPDGSRTIRTWNVMMRIPRLFYPNSTAVANRVKPRISVRIFRRRTIWIALAVIALTASLIGALLLRKRAAPEPARLLPEADAYIYVNLKPIRRAGALNRAAPISREPDYERFVAETGFEPERDLDEAAFAVHSPPPANEAPSQRFTRYSEIFVGSFNTQRVNAYLRKISQSVDRYRDTDIYNVPLENRTVRIALLGPGTAAISNTEGTTVIHGMIDRYHAVALPFGGPPLVRDYYKYLPFGTLAWTIAHVTPLSQGTKTSMLVLPGGYELSFPAETVVVGSLRYTGNVDLKAEAFTANEDQAKTITGQANAFLAIFRGLSASLAAGSDPDVKAFFDSFKIEQEKDRAVLTAAMPPGFLKKIFSEPPTATLAAPVEPPAPQPAPSEKPESRSKSRGKRNGK
jgi:hypothetical protein